MGRERLFQAVVQRGRLRPALQNRPPGSSGFPPLLRWRPPASGAFLRLPWNRTPWSSRLVDFSGFFIRCVLIILLIALCNRREIEKPECPNRIVKPSRDWLDFYHCWLSGTGIEVKKKFLKNHSTLWVRRILNLLCRKHWVPYGALKGLTYRVIHTLTPCYILEISF